MTTASGWAAVMRRVASMPLMPGRLMSISTSPGAEGVGQLDRLLAALGLADHLEPGGGGDHRPRGTAERRLIVDDQDGDRAGHDSILPSGPGAWQGADTTPTGGETAPGTRCRPGRPARWP